MQSVDFDNRAKATHEERRVYSANVAEITRGKVSPDTDLPPFPQINSKWIIELNAIHRHIKLLEDNMIENLGDLGFSDDFLDITPKTQSKREKEKVSGS